MWMALYAMRRSRRYNVLKEHLVAYGFLAPALVILGVFGLFPVAYAVYVSMHQWRYQKGPFIGARYYIQALGEPRFMAYLAVGIALLILAWLLWHGLKRAQGTLGPLWRGTGALALMGGGVFLIFGVPGMVRTGDPVLFNGLKVTALYAIGSVPFQLGLALLLAYALFQGVKGKETFRLLFFLPYVTPLIASAVVFRSIFSPRSASIANRVLGLLGLRPQEWLFEDGSLADLVLNAVGLPHVPGWISGAFPSLALVSIILYNIWVYVGYDTVIFLAGLSSIPPEFYEAAQIDGAGHWAMFRHITVPLLSPTTFFLSMVALIGTFKAFNHIYIMRTPGAQDTVNTASIVIFDTFFKAGQAGYASAMAFVLFGVILSLTLLQNRLIGKKVFYG